MCVPRLSDSQGQSCSNLPRPLTVCPCCSLPPSERPGSWGSLGSLVNCRRTPSCRQRPSAQPLLCSWAYVSASDRFRASLPRVCVIPNVAPQGWESQGTTPPLNQLSIPGGQRERHSCLARPLGAQSSEGVADAKGVLYCSLQALQTRRNLQMGHLFVLPLLFLQQESLSSRGRKRECVAEGTFPPAASFPSARGCRGEQRVGSVQAAWLSPVHEPSFLLWKFASPSGEKAPGGRAGSVLAVSLSFPRGTERQN